MPLAASPKPVEGSEISRSSSSNVRHAVASSVAAAAAAAVAADTATGLALVLGATVVFTAMSFCVSELGSAVPSMQSSSVRFFFQGGLTLLLIAVVRRDRLRSSVTWLGKPENRYKMFIRGSWGIGGLTSFFFSLQYLPLADATAIVYINAPLTGLFAHLLLGEPYGRADAIAGALALLGVLFVAQPRAVFGGDGAGEAPWWAVCVALLGAVSSAMAYVSIRRIGKAEDPLVVVLWFSVMGSVVAPLLAAALQGGFVPVNTPRAAGLLLGAGVSGWAGQVLLNAGMARAPAAPAVIMRYADIPIAIILQTLVQGQPMSWLKLVGVALVCSTLVTTALKARRTKLDADAAAVKRAARMVAALAAAEADAAKRDAGAGAGAPASASGGGGASQGLVADSADGSRGGDATPRRGAAGTDGGTSGSVEAAPERGGSAGAIHTGAQRADAAAAAAAWAAGERPYLALSL